METKENKTRSALILIGWFKYKQKQKLESYFIWLL